MFLTTNLFAVGDKLILIQNQHEFKSEIQFEFD